MKSKTVNGVREVSDADLYSADQRATFADVQEMGSAGREIQRCARDGNAAGEVDEWAHVKRIAERAIARRKKNAK